MSSNKFDAFLSKVTSRVNSKEAHSLIKKELTHHLHELSKSYQRDNTKKEEADERAVKEMGNPFTIGEHLNKIHRPKMDWLLVAIFLSIVGISFLPLIGYDFYADFFYVKRQALIYCIAFFVLLAFLFIDYRKLQSLWKYFYGSALLSLVYTLMNGTMQNGALRWITVGDFTFSIGFTLLLFFIGWAGLFTTIKEWSRWRHQLLLIVLFWFPVTIYAMLPAFELALIYFFSIAIMFFSLL